MTDALPASMTLPSREICFRAMAAKDHRFDGLFFIAVRSTGIYCRPVCPAPPPKRQNISFFANAAAATAAGYRPCLRCRPELAPGGSAVDAPSRLAWAVARRIEAGALDAGLKSATGEFVLIFDADFVAPQDMLEKTLGHFDEAKVGMVQAR